MEVIVSMPYTNSLFNRIKAHICSKSYFSNRIHYPDNAYIEGIPYAWVNQDNNGKVYLCAYRYISVRDEVLELEFIREFLSSYTYCKKLQTKIGNKYRYKVIYEIKTVRRNHGKNT